MLAARFPLICALSLSASLAFALPAHAAPPVEAATPAPGPSLPAAADTIPAEDPAVATERDRIVRKGRRLAIAGLTFSGISGIGVITSTALLAEGRSRAALDMAIVSVVFATAGLALYIPGRNRMRNPERFMKTSNIALAPILSPQVQGGAVTVRF